MAVVSMKQLLEAGCHFGHATRRWNPDMAEFIFAAKQGIHIIDLKKTVGKINEAYNALLEIVRNGGQVLFVGTKKQAQEAVKEAAVKTNQFYVSQRWLGGTLTNFKTIRLRIKKLNELIEKEQNGDFEKLPKKEVLKLIHEREKLEKNLQGLKEMKRVPDALFIVDPSKEEIALKEANKLEIPVFAIVDTNCSPKNVDFIIPSNDDAVRAVKLIVDVMTNAVIEGQGGEVVHVADDDQEINLNDVEVRKDRRERFNKKPFKAQEEKVEQQQVKVEEVKAEEKEEDCECESKVEEQPKEHKKPGRKTKREHLENMTVVELHHLAKEKQLSGYSKLKKADLVELLLTAK